MGLPSDMAERLENQELILRVSVDLHDQPGMLNESRRLLRDQQRDQGIEQAYGAISDADSESTASVSDEVPKEKVFKPFREIAPICLGLWTAVFCAALSSTIVANLQIDIASYFSSGSLASWLGSAYLLGMAAFTPLWGRLTEVMGKRGAMLFALTLFTVGTALCGAATSMNFIIFARIIGGSGGGGLMTITAIIVSDLVSLADRGLYQGGVNVLFGLGAATGSVAGGWVADAFGWRAAFIIQLPPIVVAFLLILWKVHLPHDEDKDGRTPWQLFKSIDWTGSFFIVAATSTLMVASSLATSSGYPVTHPAVWGLALTCFVSTVIFILVERRAAQPILPLELLTKWSPALVLAAFTLNSAVNFSRLFMIPVYLHIPRGLNGREAGLVLLPASITGSLASLGAGYYMRRFGTYKWFQVWMNVLTVAQGISVLVDWQVSSNVHQLWIENAIGSIGGGAVITSLLTALIASVDPSQLSVAISACYLFRAIGQVLGVSLAAAIQQSVLSRVLVKRLPHASPKMIRSIIQEPARVLPLLDHVMQMEAKLAYLTSVRAVFLWVVIGGTVLTLLCVMMRSYKLS